MNNRKDHLILNKNVNHRTQKERETHVNQVNLHRYRDCSSSINTTASLVFRRSSHLGGIQLTWLQPSVSVQRTVHSVILQLSIMNMTSKLARLCGIALYRLEPDAVIKGNTIPRNMTFIEAMFLLMFLSLSVTNAIRLMCWTDNYASMIFRSLLCDYLYLEQDHCI